MRDFGASQACGLWPLASPVARRPLGDQRRTGRAAISLRFGKSVGCGGPQYLFRRGLPHKRGLGGVARRVKHRRAGLWRASSRGARRVVRVGRDGGRLDPVAHRAQIQPVSARPDTPARRRPLWAGVRGLESEQQVAAGGDQARQDERREARVGDAEKDAGEGRPHRALHRCGASRGRLGGAMAPRRAARSAAHAHGRAARARRRARARAHAHARCRRSPPRRSPAALPAASGAQACLASGTCV